MFFFVDGQIDICELSKEMGNYFWSASGIISRAVSLFFFIVFSYILPNRHLVLLPPRLCHPSCDSADYLSCLALSIYVWCFFFVRPFCLSASVACLLACVSLLTPS